VRVDGRVGEVALADAPNQIHLHHRDSPSVFSE
jgi:hypothetical protein